MQIRLKDNLRLLLHAKGIKAADLARLSGVAPSVISEWMSGRLPRNITNLQKIADRLGVSLGELCFGRVDQPSARKEEEGGLRKSRGNKTKDIFPLLLPINGSGVLEFHVRWTSVDSDTKEKDPPKK